MEYFFFNSSNHKVGVQRKLSSKFNPNFLCDFGLLASLAIIPILLFFAQY